MTDATTLLAQFHRLSDPSSDPDAALRAKLRAFFRDFLRSKRPGRGTEAEATERLTEAARRDPQEWPPDPSRLAQLLLEVANDPERLPPLSRPAQLVWLAGGNWSAKVICAALYAEFHGITVDEAEAAAEEALAYSAAYLRPMVDVFAAWAGVERRRGRPGHELTFDTCCAELGVPEGRIDEQAFRFDRLKQVANPDLREATLAALLKATGPSGEA
jgi:hypothetical protein